MDDMDDDKSWRSVWGISVDYLADVLGRICCFALMVSIAPSFKAAGLNTAHRSS